MASEVHVSNVVSAFFVQMELPSGHYPYWSEGYVPYLYPHPPAYGFYGGHTPPAYVPARVGAPALPFGGYVHLNHATPSRPRRPRSRSPASDGPRPPSPRPASDVVPRIVVTDPVPDRSKNVVVAVPKIIGTDTVPDRGKNAVVTGVDAAATSVPVAADDPMPIPPENAPKSAQAAEEEPPLSELFRVAHSSARIQKEVHVHPFFSVVLSASSCTDLMNCMVIFFNRDQYCTCVPDYSMLC